MDITHIIKEKKIGEKSAHQVEGVLGWLGIFEKKQEKPPMFYIRKDNN